MIQRFPGRPKRPNPLGVALALHTEKSLPEEDNLAWVGWMFQGVRARCRTLLFHGTTNYRRELLEEWEQYSTQLWYPTLAPLILNAWQAAHADDENALLAINARAGKLLDPASAERSFNAGHHLLEATRGAKYQGVLGRLRQKIDDTGAEPHLPVIWAAVAELFQLPPLDILTAYVREEWRTSLRECPEMSPPSGLLSFESLAHRALREAGTLMEFGQTVDGVAEAEA